MLRSLVYAGSTYLGLKSARTNEVKHVLLSCAITLPLMLERAYKVFKLEDAINKIENKKNNYFFNLETRKEDLDHADRLLDKWIFGFGTESTSPTTKYSEMDEDEIKTEESSMLSNLKRCRNGTIAEQALATVGLVIPCAIYIKFKS